MKEDPEFRVLNLKVRGGTDGTEILGLGPEQLGSKKKIWLLLEDTPECPWLFKFNRPGTGEHWAEKIAAELAAKMGLPSAKVELATLNGESGALVRSIIPYVLEVGSSFPERQGELVHGNELLSVRLPQYQKQLKWGQSEHTWENIVAALQDRLSPEEVSDSLIRLSGMTVLDAWIGNTDRHHENWAMLITLDGKKSLSPSYDHASSMGRELRDDKRKSLLEQGRVETYVVKARGAIYGVNDNKHAENPVNLVKWAALRQPEWFKPWIDRLRTLDIDEVSDIIRRIPGQEMSLTSKKFAEAFLKFTLKELREISI